MRSHILTYLCAIVIFLSCGISANWYRSYYENDDYNEVQPHKGYSTVCTTAKKMQISGQMKSVRCMPRKTLVKLVSNPGYTFYPNYARVNRCGGFCSGSTSCMAIKSNFTKVAVKMYGYNSKQCHNVLVEEHTKCKCQCSVKEEDCNAYQQYSEDNCACECMNKVPCDRERHMVWSEEICKCVCRMDSEMDCSTGYAWVPSHCKCIKINKD